MSAGELAALARAEVLVLGDALLDVYVSGSVDRISPEAPVPVLHEQATEEVLGGAANVAANVAALGARVQLVARSGADGDGRRLRALLTERGIVDGAIAPCEEVPTGRKTRVLAGYQQLVRLDREDVVPLRPVQEAAALEAVRRFCAPGARAIVVADYAKGVCSPRLLREVLAIAREHGVPVVADPKGTDLGRYAGATAIKPNLAEGRAATGEREPRDVLAAVLERSGAENVVLSCSADGVLAAGAAIDGDEPLHLRSHALQVADVSGAGDTLVAVLALALAAGLPLARAVELANAAAGVVCGKLGTATVSPTELLQATGGGAATTSAAAQAVATLKRAGARVVFTNGCFDVLHAGHVELMQAARRLGDALVVGVNDDDSVRRLKGPTRPANPLDDRVAVLSALSAVDVVVPFAQDTPRELVEQLRPHVLVKGGDYRPEDVVGADLVDEVVIVPLLEGRSTTRLLERT